MHSHLTVCCGLVLLGCATATPTTPEAGPKPEATLAWIQANVFTKSCTASSCHSGSSGAGGLTLTDGSAFAALVGVTATAKDKDGKPLLRVKAGDPDRSLLALRLAGPYGALDGMPPGLKLDQAKIDAVNAWILAGAPQK